VKRLFWNLVIALGLSALFYLALTGLLACYRWANLHTAVPMQGAL